MIPHHDTPDDAPQSFPWQTPVSAPQQCLNFLEELSISGLASALGSLGHERGGAGDGLGRCSGPHRAVHYGTKATYNSRCDALRVRVGGISCRRGCVQRMLVVVLGRVDLFRRTVVRSPSLALPIEYVLRTLIVTTKIIRFIDGCFSYRVAGVGWA